MADDHDPDDQVRRMWVRYADEPELEPEPDPEVGERDDLGSPPRVDPVAVTLRWARRHRRWLAAAAVVASTVAFAVSLAETSGSQVMTAPPAAQIPPTLLARASTTYPSGVAVGGGYLWTLALDPSNRRSGSIIERRQLSTGREVGHYPVRYQAFGITFGLGRVWTWGSDYTQRRRTVLSSLDPTSGLASSVRLPRSAAINSIAFTTKDAWLAEPQRSRVQRLKRGNLRSRATFKVPGAQSVAPISATAVAVSNRSGTVYSLPADVEIESATPTPVSLTGTSSHGLWTGHGNRLEYQPVPNVPPTARLLLPHDVALVAGDLTHGVYVALRSPDPLHYDPFLVYFSPQALRSNDPRPTARLDGHTPVGSMAASPLGGVIFVTYAGTVESWNAAG